MIVYSPGPIRDMSPFVSLGPPEGLGGKVLQGKPEIFARVDFSANGMTAGLFMSTRGRIEVTFPFTEHATMLEGEVTLTDQTGQTHTYKPGDSYFIKQGSVVIWEVKGERVIKSFFNIVEGASAAGAKPPERKMLVYTPGPIRDMSAFVPLGPPEELGGQGADAKGEIRARTDFSANGMTAGLFMGSRGRVQITFPFTEHATILEGEVILTDESGQRHTFRPGDSYFIRQGQVITWEVTAERAIKSFFNIVEGK
jgi:uncharacterized cupin superfamily protein